MLAIIIIVSFVTIIVCVATCVANVRGMRRDAARDIDTARQIAELDAMIKSFHA